MNDLDFDVAIVGYGPVGKVLGSLVASYGHSVVVLEQFAEDYPLPRAIRFDGEIMRIFQTLGIVDEIRPEVIEADRYLWFGADGELILNIDRSAPHPSGWGQDYAFYQPAVERALDRVAQAQPTLELRRGWSCEGLSQDADCVNLSTRRGVWSAGAWRGTAEVQTLRARYVVGADGARSFVREAAGIESTDLGFSERWLVVDVRPNQMSAFDHLPVAAQHCDPARPSVVVRNGATHRRWEFMLFDGEDLDAYATDVSLTWNLLEGRFDPADGEIVRRAVYEFRSILASTMRAGRVLLAGDSAHLMPPFMGEGMCSGLRDASNLAWRLDLLLREAAPDHLLDSYSAERLHQNSVTVATSVAMGQVSCMLDPAAAAARDAAFRSGQIPPPEPPPGIGRDGIVSRDPADHLAGEKSVQGVVTSAGSTGRFDDVVGRGFVLVLRGGDPHELLGEARLQAFAEIGGRVASLDPDVGLGVSDVDGALTRWLDGDGLTAILSRPDAYVFGSSTAVNGGAGLVDALLDELSGRSLGTL